MFEPSTKPRVFAMPPGADFARGLVDGLWSLSGTSPPEQFARAKIYVNTARMQRRIRELFDAGRPCLLPSIRLITDLADEVPTADGPGVSALRRRLELSHLVSALLQQEPDLAPRAALFDLSDSLARLLEEMQSEGVDPEVIRSLDVTDQSGHWQRTLRFLDIIFGFTGSNALSDPAGRLRAALDALARKWADLPPPHPIIIAGSTGSRGMTAALMEQVASLPQGALVLPGFDFDMPAELWDPSPKAGAQMGQDHPQFRYLSLMDQLDIQPGDIVRWPEAQPPDPQRNKLISLSLRPAPITAQWLSEGPGLGDLVSATKHVSLIEAEDPRSEAEAIALRLRQAVADNQTAALITPDRMLTRQVAAALDRWDIVPDDSAGIPLLQSAPGRLFRHIAQSLGKPLTAQTLLVILKHPLTFSVAEGRGNHLRFTRELELHLRRNAYAAFSAQVVVDWASGQTADDAGTWATWVTGCLALFPDAGQLHLSEWLRQTVDIAEALCAGPGGGEPKELWSTATGQEARRICDALQQEADAGSVLAASEFAALFTAVLSNGVVRDRDIGHPQVLIWGTLEARVQGADLVILGGMNEGSWPEMPKPDPWLNREMRRQAGLLQPDRQIGLSAHDYQQSIGARTVCISRAKRTAEAETVPSRWINRLTNLLEGLPALGGPDALRDMRARGRVWLDRSAVLSQPKAATPKASRPSPQPPVTTRPKQLSVTQIKTLVRDPYAIYARHVLKLNALDPLSPVPDARLRGILFHKILEAFIAARPDATDPGALDLLLNIADKVLTEDCPSSAARAQWFTRMARIAPRFLIDEAGRQTRGELALIEGTGRLVAKGPDVTLTCKADRIDLTPDGAVVIYDYKTGTLPSAAVQARFDKQLLLEAAIATQGGFKDLGPRPVLGAEFLGLADGLPVMPAPLNDTSADQTWSEFVALMTAWADPTQGYTARLAHFKRDDESPYDHLSRFGEWDESMDPEREVLA